MTQKKAPFITIDWNINLVMINNVSKLLSGQEYEDFIESMVVHFHDSEYIYTANYIDENGNKYPTGIYGSRACVVGMLKDLVKSKSV